MSYLEWQKNGWIRPHRTSVQEVAALLRVIERDGEPRAEHHVLNDVTVTADDNSNTIVVKAPSESMGLIATLIDLVPPLAGPIFSTLADRRVDLATLVQDDGALAEHIRQNVAGTFHPVGTCRMGQANDRATAVTGRSISKPVRALKNMLTQEFHTLEGEGAPWEEIEGLAIGRLRAAHEKWRTDTADLGLIPEAELNEQRRPGGKWFTTADPEITPGGCRVETQFGVIDQQFEAQCFLRMLWTLTGQPIA